MFNMFYFVMTNILNIVFLCSLEVMNDIFIFGYKIMFFKFARLRTLHEGSIIPFTPSVDRKIGLLVPI